MDDAVLNECCGRPFADADERPCSQGNCIELWCPCGSFTGTGWGPVGCACNDGPPWDRLAGQEGQDAN